MIEDTSAGDVSVSVGDNVAHSLTVSGPTQGVFHRVSTELDKALWALLSSPTLQKM